VNPVTVICRSLVRQQHQQSRADPEGGVKTPLTEELLLKRLEWQNIQVSVVAGSGFEPAAFRLW
ncbi:hypothetical protein, partial [Rhizobium sp. BK196]|uniref:hypothetical protein n=1 Tax=Rhizobium sp. BK196 TaxID=2587073 RepID=UPI001AEF3207